MNAAPTSLSRRALRVLGQALSLSIWRRPRSRVELVGFDGFIGACVLALLLFALQDRATTVAPTEFYYEGWHAHAGYFFGLLAAAWLATRLLGRPALWLSLATLTLLAGIPWTAVAIFAEDRLAESALTNQYAWRALLALCGFVVLFRTVGFLSDASGARRLVATLAFVMVAAAPWFWQQSAWFWYESEPKDSSVEAPPLPPWLREPKPAAVPSTAEGFDPETVLSQQPRVLGGALAGLRGQQPGKVDLYAVGFAGDGSEKVFRNEVEYLDQLVSTRFDTPRHTLSLINSPQTTGEVPLATLSNLRAGLAGVAARMDTSEDLLLLFLTSHGSDDHQLYVNLPPLPLKQIRPQDLRAALDDSGIRWRVVVVSACYSGGFVEALRDPRTLVITAARSDRSSFGCGSESKITWFGHAFLAEALNQTNDFERAFALADKRIQDWERAEGETPSVPQMDVGSEIGAKLAAWRATATAGAPVAFAPH